MPRAARLDAHGPEFLPFTKFFLDFPYFFGVYVHNMNVHSMNILDLSYQNFGQKRIFSHRMA